MIFRQKRDYIAVTGIKKVVTADKSAGFTFFLISSIVKLLSKRQFSQVSLPERKSPEIEHFLPPFLLKNNIRVKTAECRLHH